MKIRKYGLSTSIFMIFFGSAFVPYFQVTLGYLNGYLVAIPAQIVPGFEIAFNLGMAIFCLYCYLKSETRNRIINAILAAFFINCLVLFFFEIYLIDTQLYLAQFQIGAVIIGSSLFTVDLIREKKLGK